MRAAKAADEAFLILLFPAFCELTGSKVAETITHDGRGIAAQIHNQPGIPREWVHHALAVKYGGK